MAEAYERLLTAFCISGSEDALYEAALLSEDLVTAGLAPDDIVSMHTETVVRCVKPHDARGNVGAQQFLLEVMVAFGVRYGAYTELRFAQAAREAQIANETERMRREAAEAAEREKLDVMSVIAHELGTPLTVAQVGFNSLGLFLEQPAGERPVDLPVRIRDVGSAIERLARLREQLMAASRKERPEIEVGPVNVHRIAARAVQWARPTAEEKRLTLAYEELAQNPYIEGDEGALLSILGNLLTNAIRYTPEGGSITVRSFEETGHIIIEVEDTGVGMSQEVQDRIYERFYRAPQAQDHAADGLGLGLTIVATLVELLEAEISVVSEVDKGTTFRLTFSTERLAEEE